MAFNWPITKLTPFLATPFLQRHFHRGALLKCMEADLGLKETSGSSLGEKFDDLVRNKVVFHFYQLVAACF